MYKIFSFVLSLLLYSCQNTLSSKFQEIKIDIQENQILALSDFVSSVKIIPLETSSSSLMGQILKIETLNDRIYILDQQNNSVQIFDTTGKFINLLQNPGKGPGQYQMLQDLKVSPDGIYLLDFGQGSILHYSLDLQFINKISFTIFPLTFELWEDGFVLYTEPHGSQQKYYFYKTDKQGKIIHKFLELTEKARGYDQHKYHWNTSDVFSFQDWKIMSCKFSNDFYLFNKDEIKGIYSLNFGDKNFPDYENIENTDILQENFPYALRMNIYQLNNYLIMDYLYKRKRNFVFYNIENQEIRYGKIENDLLPHFRFAPEWSTSQGIVDVVYASTLVEYFPEFIQQIPQLQHLNLDDNPVLFIYN